MIPFIKFVIKYRSHLTYQSILNITLLGFYTQKVDRGRSCRHPIGCLEGRAGLANPVL